MGKLTSTVNFIILSNIIFFAFTELSGHGSLDILNLYFPQNESFGMWQFATHIFMHDNVPHLLFNMIALWLFGSRLEEVWGAYKFVLFYFISGIGAAGLYTLINYYQFNQAYDQLTHTGLPLADMNELLKTGEYASFLSPYSESIAILFDTYSTPLVGASGAIYGILVAYVMSFPNTRLPFVFPNFFIMAKYFVPFIIVLDLFSGVTGFSIFGSNIAHFVHVGGAITGFLLMVSWKKEIMRMAS